MKSNEKSKRGAPFDNEYEYNKKPKRHASDSPSQSLSEESEDYSESEDDLPLQVRYYQLVQSESPE